MSVPVAAEDDNLNVYLLELILRNVPKDSPVYSALLSDYALSKFKRYERWGRMEDLEEAIRRAEEAVAATPDDHPELAGRLNILGINLGCRFKRTGRIEDL